MIFLLIVILFTAFTVRDMIRRKNGLNSRWNPIIIGLWCVAIIVIGLSGIL